MQKTIQDFYGRSYLIGASDRVLLGRSRAWLLGASWAAMLAAGIGQYGYGALLPALTRAHDWTWQQGCWVLAIWTVCQGATVYPAARIRPAPAIPLLIGAVLCAAGLVSLGSGDFVAVLASHAILGGAGAGLIYGTCLGVVSRWYPERPSRPAFVTGAFAYGSVPLIALAASPGVVWPAAAVALLVLVGGSAAILRNPPENWWPEHIDPRTWALDKTVNPSLRHNRPPIRRYSVSEVVRCPVSRPLYLAVACAAAVALFDIAYLASSSGLLAAAVFACSSGLARGGAGWAGARFGRRCVLCGSIGAGALAQLVIPGAPIVGACLAGAGIGACYALLPGVVEGHFGERIGLANFGVFYGAKAAGGLAGVLLAAYLGAGGFLAAAVLGGFAARLIAGLRQPGRPPRLVEHAV